MTQNDDTVSKTIWSETLIDLLLVALQKNAPDAKVKEVLKELSDKGYQAGYIIKKVTKELDDNAARRVRKIMGK